MAFASAPLLAGIGGYALLVRGALTLDLDIGRHLRPLGPIERMIAAPPEVVFDVIAAPYLDRTPRAMEGKLRVWERSGDMVLAEHFTKSGILTTSTLETVSFKRPHMIRFRLVRGPVPHVAETYELRDHNGSTQFIYSGELGTDLWSIGRCWGKLVAPKWEHAVATSLDAIQAEAERRASPRPA